MVNTTSNQAAGDNDELSLVDLASILLLRRRIFYVVFLLVLCIGIAYAIFSPEKYEYSSLVELAAKGDGEYVDKPSLIVASLENRWLPEVRASYFSENETALPFELVFKNPEGTGLVGIKSAARPSDRASVEKIHEDLISKVKELQSGSISKLRKNLAEQINSLDSTIEMLQKGQDTGNALAETIENKLRLSTMLDSLEPMEILVLAERNPEPEGLSRTLIGLLSIILGLMLGSLAVFFVEFCSLVKSRMNDE